MNSKILLNETKVTLDEGITLYYGSTDERNSTPMSITVKGKFITNEDRTDNQTKIRKAKNDFMHHVNNKLDKLDWIDSHYIFTTDFTECGIVKNKSCKWKYKIFVNPKQPDYLEKFRLRIIKLGEDITDILEEYLNMNGFEMYK